MTRRCAWPVLVLFLLACSSTSNPPPTGSGARDAGASPAAASDAVATADTWASYADGFFTKYCVSCHNVRDTTGRDYTVRANLAKDKASMRCGVAVTQDPSWNCGTLPLAKQFPIGSGPKPTDAERDRIVAWITAGER
jgi:cytochrome c551/c552